MKKVLFALLALLMLICLVGCEDEQTVKQLEEIAKENGIVIEQDAVVEEKEEVEVEEVVSETETVVEIKKEESENKTVVEAKKEEPKQASKPAVSQSNITSSTSTVAKSEPSATPSTNNKSAEQPASQPTANSTSQEAENVVVNTPVQEENKQEEPAQQEYKPVVITFSPVNVGGNENNNNNQGAGINQINQDEPTVNQYNGENNQGIQIVEFHEITSSENFVTEIESNPNNYKNINFLNS